MITAFKFSLDEMLSERLRDEDQRRFVVATVMDGFAELQKKLVPDLEARTEKLKERVLLMAENISLSFVNGRLVLKVAGSSETLMTELRRGTDWYEPWDKVDEIILAAAMTDPPE